MILKDVFVLMLVLPILAVIYNKDFEICLIVVQVVYFNGISIFEHLPCFLIVLWSTLC